MKKVAGFLLILSLCAALAACGSGSAASSASSGGDGAALSAVESEGGAASNADAEETSAILDDVGMQMLLTSEYDSPQEIDLYEMFYNGALDDSCAAAQGVTLDRGTGLSEEERALLADAGYQEDLDLTRVRREDMDNILRYRTGSGLDETEGVGLDRLVYLEDYDAYYYCHSDANLLSDLTLVEQRDNEDGSVTYCYTSLEYDGELTLDADGYVLSNRYTASHLA